MKITATGRAGHGSMVNDDNAVTALCEAVARLGRHTFPVRVTKTVRTFLNEVSEALGHRARPRRHGRHGRQARPAGGPHRRHAAQHGQPDDARGPATSTT